jgi:hypothetical protein
VTDQTPQPAELKPGDQPRKKRSGPEAVRAAITELPAAVLTFFLVVWTARALRMPGPTYWIASVWGALLLVVVIIHGRFVGAKTRRKLDTDPSFNAPTPETQPFVQAIQVWEKIIDVQMHFNDMLMRTRNYALTLVLAVLAGAGVALEKRAGINLGGFTDQISLATLLLLVGVLALFGFYLLDRFYYHTLLVGSVEKAREIEEWLFRQFPALDLAGVITTHSRMEANLFGKKLGPFTIYARHKLTIFYLLIMLVLAGLASAVRDEFNVPRANAPPARPLVLCSSNRAGDTLVVWLSEKCAPETTPAVTDTANAAPATLGPRTNP